MACGMVYAEGEYDYDLIYSQSDKLMYAEKQAAHHHRLAR